MSGERFNFASGNVRKLLAIPGYALSWLIAFFVPRARDLWVFGSGIGVGEGALEVARTLSADDPNSRIVWMVADDHEMHLAALEGFESIKRASFGGFWTTLRAGQIIITHGLGDVNRYGVFGGRVINLIHGAPLKKLHLDSPVTTVVRGPAPLRAVLRRMYEAGTKQIALYVAGSVTAAERLRSAYRVDPGRVRVLGDARDEPLCRQARDPEAAAVVRAKVRELLGLSASVGATPDQTATDQMATDQTKPERLVLYAPTWRDGAPDPAAPDSEEAQVMLAALEELDAHLVIRSHPLGAGAYDELQGSRVHRLGNDKVRDITPLLGAFDAIVTDYSSIAIDFALLSRPIVWFAPDLEQYTANRGLYEPLEVTASGQVQRSWLDAVERLRRVLAEGSVASRSAVADARALATRFHAYPEGGAARRVISEVRRLSLNDRERIAEGAVFFESFYGRQVSCNPLALDREIAQRLPETPRYWSVISERMQVPEGATALLVGSPDWFAARRMARLLIVNDWLRYKFRRGASQTVLQTWHGTMLKHLALGRPNVGLRTRLAIHRESRRWNLMLSQNSHSTQQFRTSYAFRGEVLETGYPRDDRLADALAGDTRIDVYTQAARRALNVPVGARVLAYAPTWREHTATVDLLDVQRLASELGDDWVVVARGHTRSGGPYVSGEARVIDASAHADVNDVILAADLLVTDYSSVMFDASVARVPMAFFVPDLADYRDRERGFTFDFESAAPGPMFTTREQVVAYAHSGAALGPNYEAWRERFNPHDDGVSAQRVIDALIERGLL